MKRTIILTIFIMTFFSNSHLYAQTLVLWHADGTTTDIELFTKPCVQFTKDKTLVLSPVLNMEYPAEDVIRFTYKGVGLGIDIPHDDTDLEQKDGKIILHGIKPTDKIAIYKSNGIRLPVRIKYGNSNAVFSLASIPSGVYLLNVNGRTSKITKK